MFSQMEFNLATTTIIVKRRSGTTLELEVKQLYAARLVKTRTRENTLNNWRMDNTRAAKRYLRSMRTKKQMEVTVTVGQEEAIVAVPKVRWVARNESLNLYIFRSKRII